MKLHGQDKEAADGDREALSAELSGCSEFPNDHHPEEVSFSRKALDFFVIGLVAVVIVLLVLHFRIGG